MYEFLLYGCLLQKHKNLSHAWNWVYNQYLILCLFLFFLIFANNFPPQYLVSHQGNKPFITNLQIWITVPQYVFSKMTHKLIVDPKISLPPGNPSSYRILNEFYHWSEYFCPIIFFRLITLLFITDRSYIFYIAATRSLGFCVTSASSVKSNFLLPF